MGRELTQDTSSRGLTEEGIVHVPGLSSRWVRLANGAKAHYVTSGETGPAVILLHGGIQGSSGTAGWRFMAPFLGANGFRVYCPDQPGFGLSDTREEYRPTRASRATSTSSTTSPTPSASTSSTSAATRWAAHNVYYVVNHPERVLSYATSPACGMVTPPEQRVAGKDGKFTPNPNYSARPSTATTEEQPARPHGRHHLQGEGDLAGADDDAHPGRHPPEGIHEARTESAARLAKDPNYQQWADISERLPKLTIPAIYLYGKHDVLGPVENGFIQEDVLPNVQFFYPDECGHQGQTDQPDMFNQVFLEFFRDGKVSRKTADWAGVSNRRPENPTLVEQGAPANA